MYAADRETDPSHTGVNSGQFAGKTGFPVGPALRPAERELGLPETSQRHDRYPQETTLNPPLMNPSYDILGLRKSGGERIGGE
ncbi:hypothetical protein [Streptomyces dengpaensis]|uniref:hypothetical protein n=1 Tax=Streptomyces dengpaensis TaxID=2049881 RepID=UPI0019D11781|nr:hypothetical protein [Streptomyces dengpaensis]